MVLDHITLTGGTLYITRILLLLTEFY